MFDINKYPVLLLNGDYRPLETFPLKLLSQDRALKGIYEGTHVRVADYDKVVHSPSVSMNLPSVVALKRYIKRPEHVSFNRFNVFLRDKFRCQYCGEKDMRHLTYDHVIPQCDGGLTTWENVVAACNDCNTAKDRRRDMKPKRMPYEPTFKELEHNKLSFPPNYLHESWIDYLYWDSELEAK
jgi:5-methylcytosine-specific restriction endonuclease McrA